MRNAQTFLHMKTLPLWVGDVLFTYGNVAARTFGRAHRRRPYHFSCGSMSQDCRRGVRRQAKMRKIVWQRGLIEAGRGGACVPARVALQGRIHQQQMCIIRNAQTFLHMETLPLWVGDMLFADGNVSFAHGECALYAWKRRCADVRAGTQAPAPTISRMACTIRLSANSSLRHKHECIVVANSLPHHKHKCIVVANSLPHHRHKHIVVANSLPHHKHECIVVANSSLRHKHNVIVVANSLPHHKHECIVAARCSPRHKHKCIVVARYSLHHKHE